MNCKRYGPPKSTNFGENGRSKMQRCKEHGSGDKKCNQHDRSDDISHTTYYFQIWKSIVHVSGKKVVFLRSTHKKQQLTNFMGRP